jgi:phosphatidylserine/phosphatidylglycerophosphate/cardiolipin synthase-like enzyme
MPTEFIINSEIYRRVIQEAVPEAEKFVWIATADLKDLYVKRGRRMIPFLEVLAALIEEGVSIRLIHAKEPGPIFREEFDRFASLLDGLEQILCPRVHFKSVIIDGKKAFTGSANLTGAGMGAKSDRRRNFENGFITDDKDLIAKIASQFDDVWMGKFCVDCDRKKFCAEFNDLS